MSGRGASTVSETDRTLIRIDAPNETALDRTSFGILGATTRDNRRRIVELSDEKALMIEPNLCSRARSDLTNPRNRLGAELAWLPGISPKKACEYAKALRLDPAHVLKSARIESPIVRANLIAAAIELFSPDATLREWVNWILELAAQAEAIDVDDLLRSINEDRVAAGFPEVQAVQSIEEELATRCRVYKDAANEALNRLTTSKMLLVISDLVAESTLGGKTHGPALVDDLIDSFSVNASPFLAKEAENVEKIIGRIRTQAKHGEKVVRDLLSELEVVVRNWNKVARPIQMNMRVRGLEHEVSTQLAVKIRDLGIDLYNNHEMLDQAQRVTKMLQNLFFEIPAVMERVAQDDTALKDLFEKKTQIQRDEAEWARDVTYEASIGLMFKDRLRISPDGIEWKQKMYPLASIDTVWWGGVSHSINGIPSGTTYTIGFTDARSQVQIETNRKEIFSNFTEKLWRAVCGRIINDILVALKQGARLPFGQALVDDNGVRLVKHKFLGNENVYFKWSDISYYSAGGTLVIQSQSDKKIHSDLPYLSVPNAHLLEAIIRMSFKSWKGKLSGLLE